LPFQYPGQCSGLPELQLSKIKTTVTELEVEEVSCKTVDIRNVKSVSLII
jgi:hypothetical protein